MTRLIFFFFLTIILIWDDCAWAYMGPGAGLSMLRSFLAVIFSLGVAVLGLILYPVRIFLKRNRRRREKAD